MIRCTEAEFRQHQNDYDGCCLSCFEWTSGDVEPDAENYMCEACGEEEVFGAETLLIDGLIEFV